MPIDLTNKLLETLARPIHDGRLAEQFLSLVRRFVEDETGLPPCEEVHVTIMDDPRHHAYKLFVSFPGNYECCTDISQMELVRNTTADQLGLLEGVVRRMARDWARKI